nr:RNA-directed DNA polymerase, eukaryota [Tanacetum cinerariifolium]
KDRIRSWLSIHRLNSRGEIYYLKEELRACDEAIDKGDYSNEVVQKRTEILNKIHSVSKFQASKIAQKAKIKWAIEGDENVKFFHGMLNKKRNQSNIRGRFDKPSANRACLDTPFPVSLSTDQKEDLERIIAKEEVKRAVWDCGIDKSSGPDGFSFSFYRHFWPIIEKDVFEAVEYFFMKKKHTLIFKDDFEKAFDSVRWDFVDDVLNKFGFDERWRTWIQSCLSSSRGSILVNGSPTEEFQFFRGLKQESSRKGQNRIKTRQKWEAWRSQEKSKAVTVDRARKTEENKKRMNENANTIQELFKFKEKKKREGPKLQFVKRSKKGTNSFTVSNLYQPRTTNAIKN